MGLAYNALKAGKYYKGDMPTGWKVFLYVEALRPGPTQGHLEVLVWEVQRTKGAPVGSLPSGWLRKLYQNIPGSTDSYMRREVTPSEVQAEGFPLVPSPSPASGAPSSTPATGSKRSEQDEKPPAPSGPPSKPRALRKNGTPKETIPGNKTSAVCLYCAKPNKTLVLFSGSTRWCPDCEP